MKKILFALLALSAASFAFAGGDDKAKCDDKDAKACCCKCCCCCEDDKAACEDKAATDAKACVKPDAKPAETPAKK